MLGRGLIKPEPESNNAELCEGEVSSGVSENAIASAPPGTKEDNLTRLFRYLRFPVCAEAYRDFTSSTKPVTQNQPQRREK
jgi:hypothetical protein